MYDMYDQKFVIGTSSITHEMRSTPFFDKHTVEILEDKFVWLVMEPLFSNGYSGKPSPLIFAIPTDYTVAKLLEFVAEKSKGTHFWGKEIVDFAVMGNVNTPFLLLKVSGRY
jgi:hypothetical protein